MNIYLVMRNGDLTEGRGPMVFKAAFTKPEDAVKYAKSIEPYGADVKIGKYNGTYADGQFTSVEEVTLHESFESKAEFDIIRKREEALKKLTMEERKLLGLE